MTHSSFAQPLPAAQLAQAAAPYGADGQPLKEGAHVSPEVAPDGLWTTPTDLARFAIAVQQALNGFRTILLDASGAREMLEQGGLANRGSSAGARRRLRDDPYFWHSGSNCWLQIDAVRLWRWRRSVDIMTNSDNGERLAADIARTVAYEYGWADFQPLQIAPVTLSGPQLDGLVGRYRIGRYATLAVTPPWRPAASPQTPDKPSFRIYPKSATQWFAIDPDGFYPNPGHPACPAPCCAGGGAVGLAMRKDGYDTRRAAHGCAPWPR